jgi:rSAM/selenodomain-associated transferase 2
MLASTPVSRGALPPFAGPGARQAVSIIIPTFNEADGIAALLAYLWQDAAGDDALEIIVVDGGSTDATRALAQAAEARVLTSPQKGRAAQLNHGAQAAIGSILYFLHADSYPPAGFLHDIRQALAQGAGSGCYRLAFDHPHWFLRANAWMTRFRLQFVRFGDQSLFVPKTLFQQVGGYRTDLLIMEDQEIVQRLWKRAPFWVLPRAVTTSARKYLDNGVYRLQGTFTLLVLLYWLGVSQPRLVRVYRRLIRQNKL